MSSAQVPSATVTSNFRVRALWEASHSEGDAGHSPLRSRRAQRASLGAAVCRVARGLALGISKFPSWPQSVRGNSGILTATAQSQYFPDCTVLTFTGQVRSSYQEFPVRSGSHDWPNSLLLYTGKTSVKSSQLSALAAQGRIQCQLALRLSRGLTGGESPYHHVGPAKTCSLHWLCVTRQVQMHTSSTSFLFCWNSLYHHFF